MCNPQHIKKESIISKLPNINIEDGYLVQISTPTKTINYHLGADNQRVAKEVDGVITEKYFWANLTTLLAIYDKDDNLIQRFNYIDNRMPISV